MKRIIFVITSILIISAVKSSAQVGFEAAYTMTDFKKDEKAVRPMHGFYAGLSYNLKFTKILSIAPGLRYSFGSRSDGEYDFVIGKSEESTQVHLVEAPLNLKITIPLGKSSGLVIYGGPTFSYAVSGERAYEFARDSQSDPLLTYRYDYFSGKSSSDNISDSFLKIIDKNTEKDLYKRFDVMLGAGAGFLFGNMFIIHAGYDWGMLNRYTDTSRGDIRRNVLHIGATFLF